MSEMSDVPVEVVLAAFNDEKGAENALRALMQSRKYQMVVVHNAAVLWKDDSGKLHFKETADMRGGKGAKIGGVVGGVVGLIFPPAILASAAVGAAVGGLSARLHDAGFPDDRLRQVGERLKPNTSGLIAVIEQVWVERVEDQLRGYGADVATEAVRADIVAQLEAEPPVSVPATEAETATTETATTETATTDTSAPSAAAPTSSQTPPPVAGEPPSNTGPSPA
jgi:uncharacterized membrane protein